MFCQSAAWPWLNFTCDAPFSYTNTTEQKCIANKYRRGRL
jgi:hypothetical protein